MSRVHLHELRAAILDALDDEWRGPTELCHVIGFGGAGDGWYSVALVLERLANDGIAEIRVAGNRRKFRRAGP